MRPSPSAGPDLDGLIRRDQLEAVRASVAQAIPVNLLLGLAGAMVAQHAGLGTAGWLWFSASILANGLRLALCRAPCGGLALTGATLPEQARAAVAAIDRRLRLSCLGALLSGLIWACLPVLCAGYTSAQTLFYLAVTCGITAGAVSYGMAYARIPVSFITPPLLSVAGCLYVAGGFDRTVLALTVLLYLGALVRSALATERGFRETSRLKNEATALAHATAGAHAEASALAVEMGRRASHDGLTGLLNRAGFARCAEARLGGSATACLLLLDLDGFKSVNDVYGHKTGDRVLVEVARRLGRALPPGCDAARLGGDEFAVIYDPAVEEPRALALRLIRVVAEPFESFDTGRLGMSVGVCHASADDLTHLLSCADAALYAAKDAGRNQFRVFDEGLRRAQERRRDCERDLSWALAEGSLDVWFQPIYGGGGARMASLEALIRWHHPVHGWVPPPEVIAAAAAAGLAESVLRVALEGACAMLADLRARGLADVSVALNVSPREMAQLAVDEIVLGRLQALGLPPARLGIEITEETALDIEAVQGKLMALTRAGVGIALDDFGAGYSSLACLRRLRASRLKVDRSLVTGLSADEDKRGLVQAVLGLGRALGIEVVAEGVETEDDLVVLRATGCLLQGYHLCRPAPAAEILDRLDDDARAMPLAATA